MWVNLSSVFMRDPSGKDPKAEGWGMRDERLKAVAEKFDSADIQNDEMREHVLNLLIKNPASRLAIDSSMVEMAKGWSVRELARETDSSTRSQKIGIYSNYLRGDISKGNLSAWKEALEVAKSMGEGAIRNDFMSGLFGILDQILVENPSDEILRQLLPFQYQALSEKGYRVSSATVRNLLVMHFGTGTEEQLKERIDGLDHEAAKRLAKVYRSSSSTAFTAAYKLLKTDPVRLRFLNQLLNSNSLWATGSESLSIREGEFSLKRLSSAHDVNQPFKRFLFVFRSGAQE